MWPKPALEGERETDSDKLLRDPHVAHSSAVVIRGCNTQTVHTGLTVLVQTLRVKPSGIFVALAEA